MFSLAAVREFWGRRLQQPPPGSGLGLEQWHQTFRKRTYSHCRWVGCSVGCDQARLTGAQEAWGPPNWGLECWG